MASIRIRLIALCLHFIFGALTSFKTESRFFRLTMLTIVLCSEKALVYSGKAIISLLACY